MRSRSRCFLAVVVGLLLISVRVQAQEPSGTETAEKQLRETSQKVLDLFRDADLVAPENTEKLVERLHEVLGERFDWVTMGKWVLGRHRSAFTQEQTETFADLFSEYVVLYYLAQVEEYVVTGKPEQVDQVSMEFRDARVRRDGAVAMEIIFKTPNGTEVQTGYTLVEDKQSNEWQIRNFIVEGVSLVRNWRTQLARMRTPDEVIDTMRSKVQELRQKREERNRKGEN